MGKGRRAGQGRVPRRRPQTAVYGGTFGREQAARLLWRAGFGPEPGQDLKLARMGLRDAVDWLLDPPSQRLAGPKPTLESGPFAPSDTWGHDQLWWLDRMVRTRAPLIERMTLVWHDWFATSRDDVPRAQLMLDQNATLRRHALGQFRTLAHDITRDPAMLLWLSGSSNTAESPNENYARELMELFTVGADAGYTELDVREQARALTGFTNDWEDTGPTNFRYDREQHDGGTKTVFGKKGRYGWREAVDLCIDHPRHSEFVVRKLWDAFIPVPPSPATVRTLARRYRDAKTGVRPVVEAILLHPALHDGPRMVKPPVVVVAGMLRATGRTIDTDAWAWVTEQAGQQLFVPPSVAGWDDTRWMDTARWRARWAAANISLEPFEVKGPKEPDKAKVGKESARQAVHRALRFWGQPAMTAPTRRHLLTFAADCTRLTTEDWQRYGDQAMRQNALRQLIATSPDFQTS